MAQSQVISESNQSASEFPFQRYFVTTGHGGGWLVFREGVRQAIHSSQRKIMAVETAKVMARNHVPSQVMVERSNGSFFVRYHFA